MALKLKGSTSGFVALDSPAVAGNNTITLPDSNGSANQVWANDNTAGVTTYTQVTINRNGDIVTPGTLSIGGTITYEDVTNVDSVGIITARQGLRVNAGGANIVGVVTVTPGTGAFHIDSSGRVLVGTSTEGNANADDLTVNNAAEGGITIRSGASSGGNIYFSDATSGAGEYAGMIEYKHSTNVMLLGTGGTERFRVNSDGTITQGTIQVDGAEGGSAQIRMRADEGDDNNDTFRFLVEDGGNGLKIQGYNGSFQTRLTLDTSGRVLVGHTATAGKDSTLQVIGNGGDLLDLSRYVANEYGPNLHFVKSRSDTSGAHTIVQANDDLGIINFRGSDGNSFDVAAEIRAEVDGTPGAGDMPGRLILATTADGASTATDRMTISASGQLRLGSDHHSNRTSHTVQASASGNAKVLSLNNATNVGGSDIDLGFYARNSNNATVEFGRISVDATTTTANSSQAGYMAFFVNSSATMVERFRITSAGNFNIGTNGSYIKENQLHFQSAGAAYIDHATTGQNINFRTSDSSSLDTTAMTIADDGRVNLPSVTVSRGLELNPGGNAGTLVFDRNGTITSNIRASDGGSNTSGGSGGGSRIQLNKNYIQFLTFPYVTNAGDAPTYTERVRIPNATWGLLVTNIGSTGHTGGYQTEGVSLRYSGDSTFVRTDSPAVTITRKGNAGKVLDFYSGTNYAGGVYVNGQNSADYQSSSDYRLKDNVNTMSDGISKVKQLNPIYYTNKQIEGVTDTTTVYTGFLAHEVESVIPTLVNGEKDAPIDEKGKGYQTLSYGRFSPTVVAAMKELIAKVETLEAEVAALKSA